MINFQTGDILRSDADAIVNTVNCVGIMGRGIALQFKNAYPENFKAYAEACARDEVQPGKMFVFETGRFSPRFIVNFPTKRHWRGKSRIEDIESGLQNLVVEIRLRGIRSIAIPPLGAGLGGLVWPLVKARIVNALHDLTDVEISVFEPNGAPDPKTMARAKETPSMSDGRASLVVLIHRYLSGLLDPYITLLEVHKLMYFMQAAGQPLGLRYCQALYGPYAVNLTHVLRQIEGHYISGYADGGDTPNKRLELVPGALEEADLLLATQTDIQDRFSMVARLVEGFESPFGMELLSTVHWVMTNNPEANNQQVINIVHEWNDRKKSFSPRQIEIAIDHLQSLGWHERVVH